LLSNSDNTLKLKSDSVEIGAMGMPVASNVFSNKTHIDILVCVFAKRKWDYSYK